MLYRSSAPVPLKKIKLVNLRQIAKILGIKSSGNKGPLLNRIETYFSNESWPSNLSQNVLIDAINNEYDAINNEYRLWNTVSEIPKTTKDATKNELIYQLWRMKKLRGKIEKLFEVRLHIDQPEKVMFPKQKKLIDEFLDEFCDDDIPKNFSLAESNSEVDGHNIIIIPSIINYTQLNDSYMENVKYKFNYYHNYVNSDGRRSAKIGNQWLNYHGDMGFGNDFEKRRGFVGRDYPLLFLNQFTYSYKHYKDYDEGRFFRVAFRIFYLNKNENNNLKIHLLKTIEHYPKFEKILFECEKHGKFVLNGSNITLIERDTICQECYEGLGSGFKMTGDAIFYVFKHHNSKLFNGGISNLQSYEVRKKTHQRESGDFEIIEELTGHSSSIFGLELALKKDLLEDIKNVERYEINPLDYARKMEWVQEQTIVIEPLLNK